jgi:hypothetical protein
MQAVDNEAVPVLAILKPLRYARDGGLAKAGGLLNARVRKTRGKHLCSLETLSEFNNLRLSHKVTQKTPRLVRRVERKQGAHELLIFRLIPVHGGHSSKMEYSSQVEWYIQEY